MDGPACHRTFRCAMTSAPPTTISQRLVGADGLVCHWTVQCVAESSGQPSNGYFVLEPIYTSPNRAFECVGAKGTYQRCIDTYPLLQITQVLRVSIVD
jgi:hypothetical protein